MKPAAGISESDVAPAPWWPGVAVALPLFVAIVAGALFLMRDQPEGVHVINAEDQAAVARGAAIYAANCASCHGAHLQGEAGWQVLGPDKIIHAPPQNETGHTWMHPDEELFHDVKYRVVGAIPPGYVSSMPAFAGRLSDGDILAALAFIKRSWPVGVRAYQAMLNPDDSGMPQEAVGGTWSLPADCGSEPVWSTPRIAAPARP